MKLKSNKTFLLEDSVNKVEIEFKQVQTKLDVNLGENCFQKINV